MKSSSIQSSWMYHSAAKWIWTFIIWNRMSCYNFQILGPLGSNIWHELVDCEMEWVWCPLNSNQHVIYLMRKSKMKLENFLVRLMLIQKDWFQQDSHPQHLHSVHVRREENTHHKSWHLLSNMVLRMNFWLVIIAIVWIQIQGALFRWKWNIFHGELFWMTWLETPIFRICSIH